MTECEVKELLSDMFIDAYILQSRGDMYQKGQFDAIARVYRKLYGLTDKNILLKVARRKLEEEGY